MWYHYSGVDDVFSVWHRKALFPLRSELSCIAQETLILIPHRYIKRDHDQNLSPTPNFHHRRSFVITTMLNIDLRSFGYRRSGIPRDPSEHGGGFVFDCRSLPNPGREVAYQDQTGLDPPVRDYLRASPAVDDFHKLCLAMVKSAIISFSEREFDRIMVSYGCTGGQHRSVFLSERLRCALEQDPAFQGKIKIVVEHTERHHWPKHIETACGV